MTPKNCYFYLTLWGISACSLPSLPTATNRSIFAASTGSSVKPLASQTSVDDEVTRAIELANKRQTNDAINLFSEILKKDPSNASANLNIAILYANKYDYEKALPYLIKIQELVPKNETYELWLGRTFYKLERYAEADSHYNNAFKLGLKRTFPVLHTAGHIKMELQKWNEAKTLLIEAVQLQPEDPDVHYRLGLILFNQKLWQEAAAHLEKTLIKNPEWVSALSLAGHSYYEQMDYDNAEKHLKKAIKYDLNHADSLLLLAYIGIKRQRFSEALEYMNRVSYETSNYSEQLSQLRGLLTSASIVQDIQNPDSERNRYQDYIRLENRDTYAQAALNCYYTNQQHLQGLQVRESIMSLLQTTYPSLSASEYEFQEKLFPHIDGFSRYFFAMKEVSDPPPSLKDVGIDARRRLILDAFSKTKNNLRAQGMNCNFLNVATDKTEMFVSSISANNKNSL